MLPTSVNVSWWLVFSVISFSFFLEWKGSCDVGHRGWSSIDFWGYCQKNWQGLWWTAVQTSPFHCTDFGNSERHTLLHLCTLAGSRAVLPHTDLCWNVLLLPLSLSLSPTHLLLLHSFIFLSVMALSVFWGFFFYICLLLMVGSQSGVWLCLIRRERQASPRQRRYSGGGLRCAAKWTSHGTPVVSLSCLTQGKMIISLHTDVKWTVNIVKNVTSLTSQHQGSSCYGQCSANGECQLQLHHSST